MAKKRPKSSRPKGEHQRSGAAVVKPRAPRPGFGFARSKDVHDSVNQEQAPSGPRTHYDRSGDEEYAEGVESFEEAGGSVPRSDRERTGSGNRKNAPH